MAKKLLSMLVLVVMLVSAATVALADTNTVAIQYPQDRTNLTYGPGGAGYYCKKTSPQLNWDVCYDVGPSEHPNVSVYLYDQNSGLQATHNEPVAMYVKRSCSYLTGRCVVNDMYKVVMTAPSRPPLNNRYQFTFTP